MKKEKLRAQVKSRFYYIFWGVATASVVLGQIYVGTGYRMMAGSVNKFFYTLAELMEVENGSTEYR
jgi:hypothetical protein